ncbi:hypothetical protein ACEQ38_00030 [Ralstonia syzygii subsp. celebesensis]|nr:hypothetical protein [Ralstonia syzygii]QQV55830.1 hypothetical protein JK151_01825 [Ralstonia syzygii subsp. celebesensis]
MPQVRRAAADGLLTLLATIPAEHFIPLLPRLRGLTEAKRTDHAAWLFRFEQQLIRAGGRAGILDAIHSPDLRLRRAAYFVCHAQRILETAALAESGLRSGDIVLARHATTLIETLPASRQPDLVHLAYASSFGPVRLHALRIATQHAEAPYMDAWLHKALFDAQASMRHVAARILADKGIDVGQLCTQALASGNLGSHQVRAALSVMVEIGASESRTMLSRYMDDPRVDIRVRILTLQARLDPASRDALSHRALQDASPKIRALGALLCARFGAYVPLDQVRELLTQYGDYRTALRICRREKWDHLACLGWVTELCSLNEALLVELRQVLGVWLSQEGMSWTRPSSQHIDILSTPDTAAALCKLAADERNRLAACLRVSGIWT